MVWQYTGWTCLYHPSPILRARARAGAGERATTLILTLLVNSACPAVNCSESRSKLAIHQSINNRIARRIQAAENHGRYIGNSRYGLFTKHRQKHGDTKWKPANSENNDNNEQ